MKKKFMSIILAIATLYSLTACGGYGAINIVEKATEVKMPKGTKVVCYVQPQTFTGVASAYIVLQLKEEPEELLDSGIIFSKQRDTKTEELVESRMLRDNVPIEYYPDWEKEYYWYNSSIFYIACFPDMLKIVFYRWGY